MLRETLRITDPRSYRGHVFKYLVAYSFIHAQDAPRREFWLFFAQRLTGGTVVIETQPITEDSLLELTHLIEDALLEDQEFTGGTVVGNIRIMSFSPFGM